MREAYFFYVCSQEGGRLNKYLPYHIALISKIIYKKVGGGSKKSKILSIWKKYGPQYVDELLKQHNDYFLASYDFIKNFDELGEIVIYIVCFYWWLVDIQLIPITLPDYI